MFRMDIKTDNAAFEEDRNGEVIRLLKRVIEQIENGEEDGSLLDINGNKVGKFKLR